MQDNERGLSLAADGDWAEASEAFGAAADCLARILPSETRGVHEPLALVLGNLAQAYFRLGRTDEAMQQAQRACSLRVAIAGEDGMPVARARMDMAVMLASVGRVDEATALVQRAIVGIEHRVGEEDARLAIVLENAARIALAAGNPANAEPLLLRLHALLGAHELSTSRAESLLARVAAARARQAAAAPVAAVSVITEPNVNRGMPTPFPVADAIPDEQTMSSFDDDDMARVYAHASIAEQEQWEDQPLRDAVAVTDVLLRTTPSGVPIIPAVPVVEPPSLDMGLDEAAIADDMLDTMDLTDVLPAPALAEPEAEFLLSLDADDRDSPLSALSLDLADEHVPLPAAAAPHENPFADDTDFDLDLAFDDAPAPKRAATPAKPTVAPVEPVMAASRPESHKDTGMLLGFDVDHGMADEEVPLLQRPPISSPIPGALDVVPMEPPAPTVVPVTHIVTSGPTAGIAPIADIMQTAPLSSAPASPASEPAASRATSPSSQRPVRRTAEERDVPAKSAPAKGKGGLIAIIAGAVLVAGGVAAFFLLR